MKKTTLSNQKPLFFILFLTLIFFVLDQWSKLWAADQLQTPLFLTSWFRLNLEKNIGIAFSIPIPYPLLIFLNFTFFTLLIIYLIPRIKLQLPLVQFAIALLSAGAIGNLFDRLRLGYVIDFISIGQFAVFNLADSFITVSVFLLLIFYDKIKRTN